MRRKGRILAAVLIAGLGACAAPGAAGATTSCSFSAASGTLTVHSTDSTRVGPAADGEIVVYDLARLGVRPPLTYFVPVTCYDADSPGETARPTTTTTDSVAVHARSLSLEPAGPGRTDAGEGGAPEIEVGFEGAVLSIDGGPGADGAVIGLDTEAGGIAANLNAGSEPAAVADTDVVAPNLRSLTYGGGDGDDSVDARGGGPIEGPLPANTPAELAGGGGADVLHAGLGPTRLLAGPGDDRLHGGPSGDVLIVTEGDDELLGGDGVDEVSFGGFVGQGSVGATIDLRLAEPQATGFGTKLIREIENVTGTGGDDTLLGDAGPNALRGGLGNDAVRGEGGDDTVEGGTGVDHLLGGPGADLLRAREPRPAGARPKGDRRIDCGPGHGPGERAKVDDADPKPRSC